MPVFLPSDACLLLLLVVVYKQGLQCLIDISVWSGLQEHLYSVIVIHITFSCLHTFESYNVAGCNLIS